MTRIIIIFITFICLLTTSSSAYAFYDPRSVDNNLVGVHILAPGEIEQVPQFTNNNGASWGYVTVPIRPTDRDKDKWQTFMRRATELKLIPIIRITTIPLGGTWGEGRDTDLVDFANFLHELSWPIGNRYIILFNEVNRDAEWGGKVDPRSYTRIVKNAHSIFKERSRDFFILGPALDSALPDSKTSLSAPNYLKSMQAEDRAIWSYFDGWASHSYPNPDFIAHPSRTGWQSIVSYRAETSTLEITPKPIFITETGWDQTKLTADVVDSYWRQAFNIWGLDHNIVAVTPFVLHGGDQFPGMSLMQADNSLTPSGRAIAALNKRAGNPMIADSNGQLAEHLTTPNQDHTSVTDSSTFAQQSFLHKIENFIRDLLGLHKKAYLTVGNKNLVVELADKPKLWEQGLSDRDNVNYDGMLFRFPDKHIPVFWMKNMRFPLDIIWIEGGEIKQIDESVPTPSGDTLPTYSPSSPVDYVLEIKAGLAKAYGFEVGTKVTIYD